jgi:starch synthase
VVPYLPQTNQAINSFEIPKNINDHGGQTRIFMPRYGLINERRHQLHEVIRLSGMNLVINDVDMPLIIKVASIPKERMQVYFIDNEEYFKRRAVLRDENQVLFTDNDERMIFFTKGVIETVKKLNWSPDIIHVHGWLASFLPLYLRNYYGNEPLFENSKIVTSVYNQGFNGTLNAEVSNKIKFDAIDDQALTHLDNPTFENVMKVAINNSDAVIIGSEDISKELETFIGGLDKPVLAFQQMEDMEREYLEFYQTKVLEQ